MRSYVIVDTRGLFWGGSSWKTEYPDAELYDFPREARREADLINPRKIKGDGEIFVIEDYGLESEAVVYKRTVNSSKEERRGD